MRARVLLAAFLCSGASTAPISLGAQATTAPRLGTLDFPTGAPAAAHAAFEEGLLWMHSFEYPRAAAAFKRAQAADPTFVMAYWGEAMTHNHAVWNERDAQAAHAVLNRLGVTSTARIARARTARDSAWLGAVEALWGAGPKPRRDTLYAQQMAAITRDFPSDEADLFYALALLGLNQGERDVPAYMRAGAIALAVMDRAPNHPGAAHYVIHAFDDPDHAILGLDAARAYSRIAPDAGHAQHMTTHIFLALGMWDDVARQNVVAMQAVTGNTDSLAWAPGHYTWWLNYARLQQGKHRDASNWLRHQSGLVNADTPPRRLELLQMMGDEWQVNRGLFDQVPTEMVTAAMRTPTGLFTRGLSVGQFRSIHASGVKVLADELTAYRTAHPDHIEARLLEPQLRALFLQRTGNPDSGLAILRELVAFEATLPMDFGPPAVLRPAHEALAEMLLATGHAGEAQQAFERALARTPGRSRTLAGLALAAKAAGDMPAHQRAMTILEQNFHAADPGALDGLIASIETGTPR